MSLVDKIVNNEKAIALTVKIIRDLGFPIVIASFLLYVGYKWGERIILSQEVFIDRTADQTDKLVGQAEKQTEQAALQTKQVGIILINQERQFQILETQTNVLSKQSDVLEKIMAKSEINKEDIKKLEKNINNK